MQGKGALFGNSKKDRNDPNDRKPDYTGVMEIENVDYDIAAWNTKSKKGMNYLHLKLSPKENRKKTSRIRLTTL